MRQAIHTQPWFISHDNLNIAFRAWQQRLDNQHHFDSGTAISVSMLPTVDPLIDHPSNSKLKQTWLNGMKEMFNPADISVAEKSAASTQKVHDVYQVLTYLLEALAFDLSSYPY